MCRCNITKTYLVKNVKTHYRILLVEDNPADVQLTVEAFKECKSIVQLEAIPSAFEALAFLKMAEKPPDLILLDLNLPGWDGKKFLREIKSDEKLKGIPIIVLTTSNNYQDVKDSYELQASCYIVKPIDIDHFFEVVKRIEEFWLTTALLPDGT